MIALQSNLATKALDQAAANGTSEVFAMFSKTLHPHNISWQVIAENASALQADLEWSEDGINFTVLDTMNAAGHKSVTALVNFLRVSLSNLAGAGAKVSVLVRAN